MTQERDDVKKLAELSALFMALDAKGQDSALTVLRSLSFAQSVTCPPPLDPYAPADPGTPKR